jgi:hypothetical protein
MVQIVVLVVFFSALTIGAVIAVLAGRMPTAEALAEQDQTRWSRYQRSVSGER